MGESSEDPFIGKVLSGRFEIIAPLGKGGMGMVYKAVQRPLDRVVALKVLNPRYDSSKDPGFERRFFLEASMTAKLKHPNTITVHDYGRTDDGIYFIAMEYLEGETLNRALNREKALPWPRAVLIGAQIARSLREAHKAGMVHRDLKPANIMLLSEGTGGDVVKVLDFGLVKSLMPDTALDEVEITQAGVLLGSPLYMAPEQAKGEADQRTDIYALGVLLFQCMAGQPPLYSKDSLEVIVKHLKEKPPELISLAPEVPKDVNALVMRCLEKKPADRFQSMEELLDAMKAATTDQGLSSGLFMDPRTVSGLVPRSSNPGLRATGAVEVDLKSALTATPRSRLPLLGGAAVLVAAIGLGAFLVLRTATPPEPLPAAVAPPPRVTKPPSHFELPKAPPPDRVGTPAKPLVVEVVFEVSSEPAGASVTRDGVVVGVTPLALTVAREGGAAAQLELGLALDGYEPTTVMAQGSTGTVPVKQALKKKRPVKATKKGPPPDGYKEDPYQ